MKPITAICAICLLAMQTLCAEDVIDVYTNQKTVTASEEITGALYIGHADGGEPSDHAELTIENGGSLTVHTNIYAGARSGNTVLTVKEGGSLISTNTGTIINSQGKSETVYYGLSTSCAEDANVVVTNRGTMKLQLLSLGGSGSGGGTEFHNFGNLEVLYALRMGMASGKTTLFHHHEGATLSLKSTGDYRFYLGGTAADAKMILDGDATIGPKVRLGYNKKKGELILNKNACLKLDPSDELRLGFQNNSKGYVYLNDNSSIYGKPVVTIGNATGSTGVMVLSGTSRISVTNNYGMAIASGVNSSGRLELHDSAFLSIGKDDFHVGNNEGATGEMLLDGNSKVVLPSNMYVGYKALSTGHVKVSGNALLVAPKIHMACQKGAATNAYGEIIVEGNGMISNTCINVGASSNNRTSYGRLAMRGGTVLFDTSDGGSPLEIGSTGDYSSGSVCGWGVLRYLNPKEAIDDPASISDSATMVLLGQIIADGQGEMRDLDMSMVNIYGYNGGSPNACKTNGWFAVNKGRVKYPRCRSRKNKDYDSIGDYCVDRARFVNTYRYTFDDATMNSTGTYMFTELYATDRTDIPAGLPSGRGIHVSSVFRIGHFNSTATANVKDTELTDAHKAGFSTLKLKFRYDPAVAEIEEVRHVKVYRHDGTANGLWRCVASVTAPSVDSPVVETVNFTPSTALWNAGWFAVVGTPRVGTVMVIR